MKNGDCLVIFVKKDVLLLALQALLFLHSVSTTFSVYARSGTTVMAAGACPVNDTHVVEEDRPQVTTHTPYPPACLPIHVVHFDHKHDDL